MPRPFSLERLLSPLSVEEFAADIWQRGARLLTSQGPRGFEGLFGFREFELVMEYGQPRPPSIRLASSRSSASVNIPFGREGRLEMDRIRRHFADGHTIIINNVQDYAPGVASLLQSMQERLSYPVEANAYMTPPDSQGFKPHYDTHDVIVAQIEGEKLWRVYGENAACPLTQLTNGDPFRRDDLPAPELVRLKAGDVFYIPRGWIHEAETDKASSLHLTFGIHAPAGQDLLRAAITALCRVHPEFRQALPVGYLRRPIDLPKLTALLERLTELVRADGSAAAALGVLEDDFIRRGRSAGDGEFVAAVDALQSLSLRTRIERKRHLHARIVPTETGVGLQFSQSLIQAPAEYREAMQFVLDRTTPFCPGELPGLGADEQINLAATLLRDGLARLAPQAMEVPDTGERQRLRAT
jgi:ribosomal protein L16 Arg81 hydroxylase